MTGALGPLLKDRPLGMVLFHGGLIFAAIVFLSQLPFFFLRGGDKFFANVGQHAFVLIWLLLITALGRTLPLRILASAFFVGVFPAMALALAIGFPLKGLLGSDSRIFDAIVVPVLEESIKAAPVLLFFWSVTRRRAWRPSMTDGLILGYVIGFGFALHEDAMYRRSSGNGFGGSEWSFLFPTIYEGRILGVGRAFSVGHAEWTALVGLAIGAGFFLRERFRWWWAIPAATFVVVTFDHATLNNVLGEGGAKTASMLRGLALDGRLVVYLLLAGVGAAVVAETLVLRRMATRDRLYRSVPLTTLIGLLMTGGRAAVQRVQAARVYNRTRRSVHYALWATRPTASDREWVARLGVALLGVGKRARLTFGAPATTAEKP